MTTSLTKSPVIQLRSGKRFSLLNPTPEDIEIEDIAHSLAHLCRFTGHSSGFYSVADHSLLVSAIVPPDIALAGLLHDAAEAYLGDISTPVKQVLDSPAFLAAEDLIQCTIAEKFGFVYPFGPEIKHADRIALATERRDLMGGGGDWGLPDPVDIKVIPSFPRRDYQRFLFRFDSLC